MTRLRERLARHCNGDRQFVEVLSLVAIYGLEAVSDACASALEKQVVASAHVVNLLHRHGLLHSSSRAAGGLHRASLGEALPYTVQREDSLLLDARATCPRRSGSFARVMCSRFERPRAEGSR
jgi:hypothetical protein